jgi:hypothetical protein
MLCNIAGALSEPERKVARFLLRYEVVNDFRPFFVTIICRFHYALCGQSS